MQKLKIVSGHDVAVKPEEIPEYRANRIARSTLRAVERFFALPGVQEDYERWLKEYEERKKTV